MILWLLGAVVLAGAAVGAGLWYLQQPDAEADADDDADDDAQPDLPEWVPDRVTEFDTDDVAAAIAWLTETLAGSQTKRARWRMAGAVGVVLAVFVGLGYVAAAGWGVLAAGLFVGALVVGASGPPLAILVFRDGLPLGGLVGQGLAIAAQIAFGRAALVRRDDGRYEWTVLRETRDEYLAVLDDGTQVPIDADAGELYSFGFGRLAVTEQKTEANLRRWMVPEGSTDGGTETRAGIEVAPPQREHGGILVSLATIQRAVRGSASSTLVRRGRDKALDDEGGTGQLSQVWTMAFATILLIVGFGMTFLALSL